MGVGGLSRCGVVAGVGGDVGDGGRGVNGCGGEGDLAGGDSDRAHPVQPARVIDQRGTDLADQPMTVCQPTPSSRAVAATVPSRSPTCANTHARARSVRLARVHARRAGGVAHGVV
jgi:hypothetical protein